MNILTQSSPQWFIWNQMLICASSRILNFLHLYLWQCQIHIYQFQYIYMYIHTTNFSATSPILRKCLNFSLNDVLKFAFIMTTKFKDFSIKLNFFIQTFIENRLTCQTLCWVCKGSWSLSNMASIQVDRERQNNPTRHYDSYIARVLNKMCSSMYFHLAIR
jgi:hypothetical protein